ncbi:MAG: M48 family metalloprotease [Actinomycetia bacterium]|nr:M48 family metalloprotease [Actinomycetes bacterium]
MPPRRSGMTELTLPPGVRTNRIEPLWRRVERNRVRLYALMLSYVVAVAGTLTLLIVSLAFIVLSFSPEALVVLGATAKPGTIAAWSFTVCSVIVAVALAVQMSRSEAFLLRRLEARPVPPKKMPEVRSVLRDMSLAAGVTPSPALYVIETDRVNAFVVGRTPRRAAVGVTRGFAEKLSRDDQRAVFANLMARVMAADTLWATAVSALAGPVWAVRDLGLQATASMPAPDLERSEREDATQRMARVAAPPLAGWVIWYGFVVIITELLSYWHQESVWSAAEKADAEGMLLLKEPNDMLAGLEHVLEYNNHVPSAGDAYSQLFYCWAGFGFPPESDPEYRRVCRLREVLGVEGLVMRPQPNVPGWPQAPRLAEPGAEALYDAPVATTVMRRVDGRVLLALTTVLAMVVFHVASALAGDANAGAPRALAFVMTALTVVVGVWPSARLIAERGQGGSESDIFSLVAFGVFVIGTLGRGILLAPVWALATVIGRTQGEEVSREQWRAEFERAWTSQSAVSAPAEVAASIPPTAKRMVHCKRCGASNAPMNRRCTVCEARLKP